MSKEEWLAKVIRKHNELRWAPAEFKDDIDVVRAAVAKDGMEILNASPRLKDDKELAMLALRTLTYGLSHLPPKLQQDPTVAMPLIALALQSIFTSLSPRLKQDPEIAMRLITVEPRRLAMIAPALQTNRGFISEAIQQNPEVFTYMSDELKRDMDFLIGIVAENKRVVPFISKEIKDQLVKHISELKNAHFLHELMDSAGVKHKRGFDARKEVLLGKLSSDEVLARADAAEAAVAPAHSKLFAHNQFHAQNLGRHMSGFLERAPTRHDWATVVRAAENLGMYDEPKAAKSCEDGEGGCSMGGKKRRTRIQKKYKRKSRRYI